MNPGPRRYSPGQGRNGLVIWLAELTRGTIAFEILNHSPRDTLVVGHGKLGKKPPLCPAPSICHFRTILKVWMSVVGARVAN
jgi:hypothetical protein